MNRFIIVRGFAQVEEAKRAILAIPVGEPHQVEIKPFVSTRSQQQNKAYMGVWLPAIRQAILDSGQGEYSCDELHEFFKKRYVPTNYVEVMGELVEMKKTTTKLKVTEFMDYVENIRQWCYENLDGFHLPPLITDDYQ